MKAVLTEERELKEKVKILEAVVQKMFVNVIKLDAEINNKKVTIKDNYIIVDANDDKTECKSKQENSFREDGNNQKPNYKPPTVEVRQANDKQNNDLKCEMCDYKCKNINTMKKHVNMKNVDSMCKICGKAFPNIKDALVHTASLHSQEIINDSS